MWRDRDQQVIEEAVRPLQGDPAVGPLFTAPGEPGDALGWVSGTRSAELIRWSHRRSPDILATPDWSSDANAHGYRGTTTTGGTAGQSTLSPHELLAGGPGFSEVEVESRIHSATAEGDAGEGWFSYNLTLHVAQVIQAVLYFTQAVVQRSHSPNP